MPDCPATVLCTFKTFFMRIAETLHIGETVKLTFIVLALYAAIILITYLAW
jgi:hypothetical protein